MSVRDIEKISQEPTLERKNKITKKKEVKENYKYVEDLMQEKLDTKVKIADKKIEISFVNDADLNRILEVLDIKE
jgi:ParB family chromosome partitioning protein